MKREAGTRLTLRHENGSVLIGEVSNVAGRLIIGGIDLAYGREWQVVAEQPPEHPEPEGDMIAVDVKWPLPATPYTYLGHKHAATWGWTGNTARPGTWQQFVQWVQAQGGQIVAARRLFIDVF